VVVTRCCTLSRRSCTVVVDKGKLESVISSRGFRADFRTQDMDLEAPGFVVIDIVSFVDSLAPSAVLRFLGKVGCGGDERRGRA